MAKIFIAFFDATTNNYGKTSVSCHYESILKEFKKAGNSILYFQHPFWNKNFGKTPKEFLYQIKLFDPDLIILFDNRCYDISQYFDCPVIIWEADSYLYFSNPEKILKNPNRFHYIVGQTVLIDKIKKHFNITNNKIFYLPPSTSVKAENLPQKTNISFIGTKFYSPDIIENFMKKNPNNKEIEKFKSIMNYIEKFPFLETQEIFNKFNIESAKIKKIFTSKSAINYISSKNRIQILSNIASLGLKIYGPKNWISNLPNDPDIVLSYQDKLIYSLKHNQNIYNSSKIGININHAQAQTGFSWRTCDIMASNACLVTQPKKDIYKLFPNILIPTYNNKHEAYEVCKKLIKENNLRKDIVLSCQEIIDKKYRFKHRLQDLEQITGINLFSKNKGKIEKLEFTEKNNIFSTIQKNDIKDSKNNIDIRLETRSKLIGYSSLMIVNQIPFINKLLMDRATILKNIQKTIENEENN